MPTTAAERQRRKARKAPAFFDSIAAAESRRWQGVLGAAVEHGRRAGRRDAELDAAPALLCDGEQRELDAYARGWQHGLEARQERQAANLAMLLDALGHPPDSTADSTETGCV